MRFLPGSGFYSDANLTWHLRQVQPVGLPLKLPVYLGNSSNFVPHYGLRKVVVPSCQIAWIIVRICRCADKSTINQGGFHAMDKERSPLRQGMVACTTLPVN